MPTVRLPDGRTVHFPDGTSQEDMVAALSQLPTPQPSHEPPAENAPAPMRDGRPVIHIDEASLPAARAGKPSDLLPTLGAIGGAAIGGLTSPVTGPVGPVVGATIGGGAGKALQSFVGGQAPDAGEAIATGLQQGTAQALGPIVELAGKGLYKGGVALLPRTLKQEYPTMGSAGFREGIALTARGAKKAGQAIESSASEADALLANAPGAVNRMAVVRELRPVMSSERVGARLGGSDDRNAIVGRARTFLNRNKGGISPVEGQAIKREGQSRSIAAYKARLRGAPVNELDASMDEAITRGMRRELERIEPRVAPVNQRTQELIGLEKGAEHAAGTGHILSRLGGAGVFGGMAGPAGVVPAMGAAALGSAMTTPGGLTSTGLALKPIAAHLPDAARVAMLLSLLSEEQPQQ